MRRSSMRLFLVLSVGLLAVAIVPAEYGQARTQRKGKIKTARADAAGKKPAKAKLPKVREIARIKGFHDWVTSVAFSPDGKTLAIGSYDVLKFWNVASKKIETDLPLEIGSLRALAYSPDGRLLAVGGYQDVVLYDAKTRKPLRKLEGHRGDVTGAVFTPDGRTLITSSDDETVRFWNIADGKQIRSLDGIDYPVQAVAISADGKLLAAASGDENRVTKPGVVQVWETASGKQLLRFADHKRTATDVVFSPDGKRLLSTSTDQTINVYDLTTGKTLGFYKGHSRPTNTVLFAPDGRTVISGSGGRARGGNEIILWDLPDAKKLAVIGKGHAGRIFDLALSRDGKTLASASYDKTVALWDVGPILAGAAKSIAAATKPAGGKSPVAATSAVSTVAVKELRVGIIGLDTSHAIAFTKALNDPHAKPDIAHCRVVAAYPKGSPDIVSSTSRVPKYTKQVQAMGVEIVDSIPALLKKVDVVLLETNDGRPHLEQVLPVLKARKRVFIDKPIAGSLTDAVAIFAAARHYRVPIFSSSSLRYGRATQAVRHGSIGEIITCDTHSPCHLEKTHPDLFWYGIHGVESLFTVMGTGCVSVRRTESNADRETVVGIWKGDRTATFHGYHKFPKGVSSYGGTAIGTKGKATVGKYDGYRPLVVQIVKFFRSGKPPVTADETLEVYAFMEAADESKRQKGKAVTLESVLDKARLSAKKKLARLLKQKKTTRRTTDNRLTQQEKADGWQLLFNGRDYTGWKCNNGRKIASPIEHGSLVPHKSGGYLIVYNKPFGDFILKCDVKMGPQCNSGVFFRVGKLLDPVQSGFEMQVLTGKGTGYHDFGAIYDLVKPSKNASRGPGKWNHIAITCKGPHITVAVNGETVARMNCDEFTTPGKRPDGTPNKFHKAVKNFPRTGYLGFQDHGHKVWFKNVKLLDLSKRS